MSHYFAVNNKTAFLKPKSWSLSLPSTTKLCSYPASRGPSSPRLGHQVNKNKPLAPRVIYSLLSDLIFPWKEHHNPIRSNLIEHQNLTSVFVTHCVAWPMDSFGRRRLESAVGHFVFRRLWKSHIRKSSENERNHLKWQLFFDEKSFLVGRLIILGGEYTVTTRYSANMSCVRGLCICTWLFARLILKSLRRS